MCHIRKYHHKIVPSGTKTKHLRKGPKGKYIEDIPYFKPLVDVEY